MTTEKHGADTHPRTWAEDIRLLELPEGSGPKEIQAAYKRLVLKYHPDVNSAQAAPERFREIAEAYGRLLTACRLREVRSGKHLRDLAGDPRLRKMPVSELGLRLRYSSSPELRVASAYLLGNRRGPEARELLVKATGDSEEAVRMTAFESLGKVGLPADFLRCVPRPGRTSPRVISAYIHSAWRVWNRALRVKGRGRTAEAAR